VVLVLNFNFMKRFVYIYISVALLSTSCQNELNVPAQGVLSPEQISTFKDADAMAISAYSQLGNDHYNYPFSLWPFGNVRADDAYKGGNGLSDVGGYN